MEEAVQVTAGTARISAAGSVKGETRSSGYPEIGLAIAVVFVIAVLIVPLPPVLLDLFLVASISLSLVVLLSALYTRNPLEFSSFPAILLLLTLFRLSLNVAGTRLILTDGNAGHVIQAFGEFVIGGNFAVGLVIFLILVGINFIVITKGAGRVAEVAARFTLDAMPGKQMAIDADLSAGIIDETEARRRREDVSRQADFYGSMDGASKFVKGDAIAALLITFINIIGGIFIGVVQRGLPVGQAVSTYTILTVGEGLVAQIPALIVSTAAGIMVTHSAGSMQMGTEVLGQLGRHPKAMWIASGVISTFALIPGLPFLPFIVLGGGMAGLARLSERAETRRNSEAEVSNTPVETLPITDPLRDLLQIDPIELEVGYGLINLVDERQGGDLLDRISMLRKQSALDLGILIPPVRIRDDIRLSANEYVIKLRGSEVARAEVMPRNLMALNTGKVFAPIDGNPATDPSFGMPAIWISSSRRAEAESSGYVVVEPATVIATHLMEVLKQNAAELLGRQDVQEMIDTLKKSHPALVDEIIPARVSLGLLHRTLQRLLRERVPIRDLVTILEAVGDSSDTTKDAEALTENVRRALGNVITRPFTENDGTVRGISLGPKLEHALMTLFTPRQANGLNSNSAALLTPEVLADTLAELKKVIAQHTHDNRSLPLVTSPSLRVAVRRLISPILPNQPVISLAEFPPTVTLNTIGTWDLANTD